MKTPLILAAAGSLSAMAIPASAAVIDTQPAHPLTASAQIQTGAPAALIQTKRFSDPDWYDDDDWRDRRHYRDARHRGYDERIYDRRGRYVNPRRIGRRDRIWRGRDGRFYCQRDNGTTGLLIGAGLGALLGRTVDTRGDRTVGTLLGGALGAVIGRELDRGDIRCR